MLKKLKMNKKGAITDVIMWSVISVVAVIIFAILYYVFAMNVFPDLRDAMVHFQVVNGQNITNITNTVVNSAITGMIDNFSWISYGILIAMALNILLGYFMVSRIHPAFFFLYFLFSIIAFIISIPLSNGYQTLMTNSVLGPVLTGEMKGASFIMSNLPIWVVVLTLIGAVILFAGIPKDKGAGEGVTP